MLSRSYGQQKIKTLADHTPAGKVFQVEGSDLHIYVPSWCLGEIDGLQLILKTHSSQGIYCHKCIVDAFFAYHSTSTIPTEKICDHLNIAAKQSRDDLLSVIIQALQTKDLGKEFLMDPDDHRTPIYKKLLDKFFLEPGTSVLMVRDSTHSPRLVVPYKLRSRFLYQVHDCINHSGITRMKELLSSYWWEFKNRDIETYVNSCSTCARCKGNYSKRDRNWEWTDVLESIVSSMNTMINSATGISPHYTITGRHPNIGLSKLQGRDIRNDNPGAYGMQINALLRQVHHHVVLANDEPDHKLEVSLNHLTCNDPIQVGDKVLLH